MNRYDGIYLLTDEQVARCCLPVLYNHLNERFPSLASCPALILPAGEQHKHIRSVERIWDFLFAHHATRHSLLVNLGGGVICDMGGFAAATYMRGMAFINVPTTLLAMVDAGAGGKTGIDYGNPPVKNGIGVFQDPVETILCPQFLSTLPGEQVLSGYAEMVKHSLLESPEMFACLLEHDLNDTASETFGTLIRRSVAFKDSVVRQDPRDRGLRQILNFGHTVGHAIEALALSMGQPILHGYCVMYGMVAEAYLSHIICGLPSLIVSRLSQFMIEHYGAAPFSCKDHDALIRLMYHDKKNTDAGTIRFALLREVGDPMTGQQASEQQIREALEYLCSL